MTINEHGHTVINAANSLQRRGRLTQEQAEEIPALWWQEITSPGLIDQPIDEVSRLAYWRAVKSAARNRRYADAERRRKNNRYVDCIDPRDAAKRMRLDDEQGCWSPAAVRHYQERNAIEDARA